LVEGTYEMRVADVPQLAPVLLALGSLGALDAGSFAAGNQGLDARFRFELADHEPVEIEQSFDGAQAAFDSASYMLGFTSYLTLNSLENVRIEGVEVEFRQQPQPQTADLLQVVTDRRRVAPGEVVPLVLEVKPYRGERFRHRVEFTIPENTPEGRYYLLIGDGTSMDAARAQIEQATPETFEQVLRQLRKLESRRELRIFGLRAAPGLAVGGEVLPQLPASVRALFGTGSPQAGTPLNLAIDRETSQTLDYPIQGALRVDLEIRRDPT
jgi:hypothetical protein